MSEDMKRREFIKVGTALTAGIPLGLVDLNSTMQTRGNNDAIRIGVIGNRKPGCMGNVIF